MTLDQFWTRRTRARAPTYTSKRFKAGLAEVRAEIAGLDTRLSMEISPAFEPEILPGRLR